MENEYVIEMLNITKEFPGIKANDNITLQLRKGEIHALLGENGAGKSTLMSILFGLYQPTSGTIKKNGQVVQINTPNDANDLNIGMVHQHFKLVECFSVLDNIILGVEPSKGLFLEKDGARKKVLELSERYGLKVEPDALISDITVGMQQRVEILKMLYRDNEVLIFDEPTAVLTPQEIEDTMNRLLAHDDYIWNREAQVTFRGKGQMAKKLDTLLYMCPKCGAMYQMKCSGNEMRCTACGNTVSLDERYNLRPVGEGSVCPELVSDWVLLERKKAEEDVKDPNFTYSGHVRVGKLPEHKTLKGDNTSVICGEGELRLDHSGLTFAGTVEGKPYSFHLTTEQVPTFGMCTDISRFYTFVEGEFMEFYPDRQDVLRWDHLTEEMHRVCGGKWQNVPYRHCDSLH